MTSMTPRTILDSVHEGLQEGALLTALGYDPTQGRPGRLLLNNLLRLRGFETLIDERTPDRWKPYQPYPKEWIRDIVKAVTGRADAPLDEAIAKLRRTLAEKAQIEG
jgi:hypothetical protein